MNILITGASGYIGGNLVKYFTEKGNNVSVITRNVTSNNIPNENVSALRLEFDGSIKNISKLDKIDVIVHAAGTNSQRSLENPAEAFEFNCLSTFSLASAAGRAGVKKFIYLSTAHVYGHSLVGEINENSVTGNPHPYAASRMAAEAAVQSSGFDCDMQTLIFRMSNCVGMPVNRECNCWHLVANSLCRQAFSESHISLKSSGLIKRDFIAISDVVKVVERGCEFLRPQSITGIYNLSSGKTVSLRQLAGYISFAYAQYKGGSLLSFKEPTFGCSDEADSDFILSNSKLLSEGVELNGGLEKEFKTAMPKLDQWFS